VVAVKYLISAFGITAACAPSFSTERSPAPGTFGERVVTLVCKRLAYEADPSDVRGDRWRDTCAGGPATPDAPATLAALVADRPRLVAAIDAIVPPDQTDALQTYLTSDAVLGLYDDGTMDASTASLAALLTELGGDSDAMAAFARLGGHLGYRTPATAIGPTRALVTATSIDSVLDTVLPAIAPGGAAEPEWTALVTAIGATLSDADAPAPNEVRASVLLRDLLLTERPDISEPAPSLLVRRDSRGVAQVASLSAPFVDIDGDGFADVDAEGRFVDANGAPLAVATPFPTAGDTASRDPDGRALDGSGAPLYAYVDIGNTVLGALSHDTPALLDPAHSTAIDFLRGASWLLGPRVSTTAMFDDGATLAYSGYDRTQSPLLDVTYGYLTILRDQNTPNVLALVQQLFSAAHLSTTARLTEDAIEIARLGDQHPEAQILANAPLWDDLRPILQRIAAKPKLVSDLMAALERPEVSQLGDRFRDFMTYSDQFNIDDSTQAVTGGFATQPDRTQPDTGFNRSLFQRLAMLINDSQVGQCNKQGAVVRDPITHLPLATYNACALFQINNLAVFYLQAIAYNKDAAGNIICESNAGAFAATQSKPTAAQCASIGTGWRPQPKANFNYQWGTVVSTLISTQGGDAFVESQSTITGFRTHPTPEALNRVLFKPTTPQTIQDTADPIVDKDGDLMKTKHAGTLPVWEQNNFYNDVRPVVQAFADAGEEQTFVDLMSVLHKHWSSMQSTTTQHTDPTGKNYTFGSNAKSWEPYIIDVLKGDLWPALTGTSQELNAITVNGKTFAQVIDASLAFIVTPQPALTDRLGHTTSTTSDGRPVTQLSPWQLLADAYNAKRARLATAPDGGAMWTDSVSEIVDILLRADQVGTGWQFKNPHLPAVTLALTQFLSARIAAHDAVNDRATWLVTDLPNKIEHELTHPIFAALVDLIEKLTVLGPPRAAIEALLHEVLDDTNTDAFATMRTGNADLVQLAVDDDNLIPLGHAVGHLLDPSKTYLPTQLSFLAKLHAADTAHTLRDITARVFSTYADTDPGVCAVSAVVDGVGDVDRPDPSSEPAWTAGDYVGAFQGVAGFLTETQHGLPRFIAIVKGRSLP
jgi:hypothetical protein